MRNCDTSRLREEFLIDDLFTPDEVKLVYSHIDRIITGSAVPAAKALSSGAELHSKSSLNRRELGVINIGGNGAVTVDGANYSLRNRDGMYIGMGTKKVVFASADPTRKVLPEQRPRSLSLPHRTHSARRLCAC